MKVARTSTLRLLCRPFSGSSWAGTFFVLSPILLLLAGPFPELGEHANVELGFSLLATLGSSCCLAGLVSNAYRALGLPLPEAFPLFRLPMAPEPTLTEGLETRERTLPVVAPSLVLPTLISGLGGWVEAVSRAPRAEALPSAA